jgi:hypothetical protein
LIDQGFDDDGRHPGKLHVERVGSAHVAEKAKKDSG